MIFVRAVPAAGDQHVERADDRLACVTCLLQRGLEAAEQRLEPLARTCCRPAPPARDGSSATSAERCAASARRSSATSLRISISRSMCFGSPPLTAHRLDVELLQPLLDPLERGRIRTEDPLQQGGEEAPMGRRASRCRRTGARSANSSSTGIG